VPTSFWLLCSFWVCFGVCGLGWASLFACGFWAFFDGVIVLASGFDGVVLMVFVGKAKFGRTQPF